MDMVLLLTRPGRLLTGGNLRDDVLDARGFHYGRTPWWALSDVLFTNNREFVGVVLYAGEADAAVAQRFALACDPRIARYLPNPAAVQLPRYQSVVSKKVSVLELRWSAVEPDQQEVTRLDDYWYYKSQHPAEDELPCAWCCPEIDGILASIRLVLPRLHY
jgi:hypothetical protein